VLANGVGLDYGLSKPLKGSVLYLGLEDGKRRLQRRMTKLVGIRPENWPEQLYLKTDWRRFDPGGLDDICAVSDAQVVAIGYALTMMPPPSRQAP
jgi:hypothetical protein